ncbi:uncharacterized protein G2W53_022460 [Senna tora]|uniref:Uncharacterized protein n=1 Tax=Senna tora TaxID=362788 RepID=A0A834WM48_9FABA|nr:uncharacterized protein G2W53_022460 [Senna tora]
MASFYNENGVFMFFSGFIMKKRTEKKRGGGAYETRGC